MLLIAMIDSAMRRMSRKAIDIEPIDSSRKERGLKMNNITCIQKPTITIECNYVYKVKHELEFICL